ncbi:hypothetical protein B0H14DRAFT_2613931 [Mycena olivaceomarginata]|nr:hypothetical protein B0H14DRAFT_2613931 [Mycena olivaceomarginata]
MYIELAGLLSQDLLFVFIFYRVADPSEALGQHNRTGDVLQKRDGFAALVDVLRRQTPSGPGQSPLLTVDDACGAVKALKLERVESQPCVSIYSTHAPRPGPSTADAAIASLKAAVPSAQVEFLAFDLTSLRAAKAAADEFLEKEAHGYTVAILAEGGWWRQMADGELSADEIELQACNGTGHFALALPLLRHRIFARHARPRRHPLERGAPRRTEPDLSYLKELNQMCSTAMNRYGNSENILFNELQRRLAGTGIYCLSVHPGLVATNIYRGTWHASYPWLAPFSFLEKQLLSPEQGAAVRRDSTQGREEGFENHIPYNARQGRARRMKMAQFWVLGEKMGAEQAPRPWFGRDYLAAHQ